MYIEDDSDLETVLARLNKPGVAPVLECIFPDVADYDTSFALVNRYSTNSDYAALGFRAGQWFETTEEVYWHFLESVPPLHMTSGGFVVGECTMGDLYESFFEIDGRYFCAVVAWSDPRAFSALWTALVAQVTS